MSFVYSRTIRRCASILSLGAAVALGFGCEKKLDNDQRKASYAIGQQIGQNLKNQQIDIDADVMAASIKDVMAGKPSKMKPEESQQAMMKLQEGIQKKMSESAEKNKAEGTKFLEQNKTQAGVKTTPSGLQYIMITEGTGKSPGPTDVVKAHYKGTLTNGDKFDSSYDRGQPAEFPLNGVIKGWTEALQLMKVGGKAKLFIPPELGYGASARPGIPANSVLIFEVELLDVKDAPKGGPQTAAAPAPEAKKGKKK